MSDRGLPGRPGAAVGVTIGIAATARAFFGLAGPMMVSRLGLAAMGFVDGAMLAHYSNEQLALHGLADPVAGRLFEVVMAFLFAGLGLAAQAAAGDEDSQRGVGRVWRQALLFAVLAGVVGAVLGCFSHEFLWLTGQESSLAQGAGDVMFVLLLGLMPAMLAMATAGVLEALGRPVLVAVAVVLANFLNIGLNLILIDGRYTSLGLPPLGAVGAAISTTLVRVVLAVVLVAYAWWLPGGAAQRYGLRGFWSPREWRQGREQRARGWSAAGNVALLATLSLCLPVMAGWLGQDALTRLTILLLALAPLMVICWGLCDAAGLRVAAALGDAGGRGRLRLQGLTLVAWSLLLLGLLFIAYAAAPRALLSLATPDPALVEQCVRLLPLGLGLVLGDMISFLFINALRSLGELRRPFLVQLGFALLLLPLAYAATFLTDWGLAGLLAATALQALLRALFLARLFVRVARDLDRQARAARPKAVRLSATKARPRLEPTL